jgi:hypothetical protein
MGTWMSANGRALGGLDENASSVFDKTKRRGQRFTPWKYEGSDLDDYTCTVG